MVKRRKIVRKKRPVSSIPTPPEILLRPVSTEVLIAREKTKQVLIRYIAYFLIAVLSALISLLARQAPVPVSTLQEAVESLHLLSTPGAVLADVLQSLLGGRAQLRASIG